MWELIILIPNHCLSIYIEHEFFTALGSDVD